MFASLRELEAEAGGWEEELNSQEFLSLVSDLVRITKGIEMELTEADVLVESAEFRKMYRQEVHRLLTYYERR